MNGITLGYTGESLDGGVIKAKDLVSCLNGLLKIAKVITAVYNLNNKRTVNVCVYVTDFKKGSFHLVLDFIESHPVLITTTTGSISWLMGTVIKAYAEYKSGGRKEKHSEVEVAKILEAIAKNPKLMKDMDEGYRKIASPLRYNKKIKDVVWSMGDKEKVIINQENKVSFLNDVWIDEEGDDEEYHKYVSKTGILLSLSKKTLRGTFLSGHLTYPIKLVMENPAKCFQFFGMDNIQIFGIAIFRKNTITRIEIVKMQDMSGANNPN